MNDGRSEAGLAQAAEAANQRADEDRQLMLQVQRHADEPALGALMDRWEVPIKNLIGRIVLNSRDAEELAQETFVRVWQQRDKFRHEAPFRPWIFAIAVNLARNRLRWWRSRPEVSLEAWVETETPPNGTVRPDDPVGSAPLERAERAATVRSAIAALPLELREVIVLFEYEHLSHAEIAKALDSTPKAVESRLYRAREKLRKTLGRLA